MKNLHLQLFLDVKKTFKAELKERFIKMLETGLIEETESLMAKKIKIR